MKCPRCNREPAIIDPVYGTLPGKNCQSQDSKIKIHKKLETYSLAKSHRIQQARDLHSRDMVQPYMSGKPNKEYFQIHPNQIKSYGVEEELKSYD